METPNRIHPLADPAESWQTKGEQIPLSGGPQKKGAAHVPYPVDLRPRHFRDWSGWNLNRNVHMLDTAMRERVG